MIKKILKNTENHLKILKIKILNTDFKNSTWRVCCWSSKNRLLWVSYYHFVHAVKYL